MAYKETDLNQIFVNSKGQKYKVNKLIDKKKSKGKNIYYHEIEFLETGYKCIRERSSILKGAVDDKLVPDVFGIGMMGYGDQNPIHEHRLYTIWYKMLARCYDPNAKNYKDYGAVGVTVDERWHRYDYFLEDLVSLPGFTDDFLNKPGVYSIDKDILQENVENKVYSKDTCIIITKSENARESDIRQHSKTKVKFTLVDENNNKYSLKENETYKEFINRNNFEFTYSSLVSALNRKNEKIKNFKIIYNE